MSILQDAEQLAYKYFKDKKDRGGNPYMQHLRFVKNHWKISSQYLKRIQNCILIFIKNFKIILTFMVNGSNINT